MATTFTANTGMGVPALNDRNYHTPINASLNLIDALKPVGGLCVSLKENPSTSLNVKVSAGKYRKVDGTIGTYAGTASQAVTLSSTKVLYLTDAGTLTVGAIYPAADHVRLATVVAGATTITSITDDRLAGVSIANAATAGTVTSVAMTLPSWYSVAGSPVTTSGTLAVTATTGQTANRFLATPNGSTGAVSLRAIVAADIPGIDSLLPTQTSNSGKFLTTNGTASSWATVSGSGTVTTVSVTSANGFAGSVATATSTPAITISTSVTGMLKGNGTAISAGTAGTDYVSPSGSWVGNSSITTLGTITTGTWTGTTIALANGGTGQTSASAAINALVPSQTGQSGNYLTTNGTAISWAAVSASGSVSTSAGTSTMADAAHIAFGTGTGTKLGTATNQKVAFYNATPVVQRPSTTDLKQVMVDMGFLAGSGVTPLDLSGGQLNCGTLIVADGSNISVGASTGSKIGTSTLAKIGFYGTTAVVQPANTNDLLSSLKSLGLIAAGLASTPLDLGGGTFGSGTITLTDGSNIVGGSTTGTKLGTATTQKLGFYGSSPIVQPSGANQAAITDSTGGSVSTTLSAITAGAAYSQTDLTNIKNAIASLAAQVAAIRTGLVNVGLIKGSA